MEAKNLIGINQLRQPDLSGYIISVTSGYVYALESGLSGTLVGYVDDQVENILDIISGLPTGHAIPFKLPISSGVNQIVISYGQTLNPVAVGMIGNSGVSDPFIMPMLTISNSTGAIVDLSETTTTQNYYMNLLVSV